MNDLPPMDLIAMVEQNLGPGKTHGRWRVFHCPFHKDEHPSFAVTNGDDRRGPHWHCFTASCGKHGGPVRWVMEYHNKTKEEALEMLTGNAPLPTQTYTPPPPRPDQPPGPAWQARAQTLVERAEAALWGDAGNAPVEWTVSDPDTGNAVTRSLSPLDWLRERGLSDDTLRFWHIGYIPLTWRDNPTRWGFGGGKPVWVPQGILIPCQIGNLIWYLKIRRQKGNPKYIHVRKSQPALYMMQTLEFSDKVVFTEGELDALLLWQEVEALTAVVTLGSASNALSVVTWGAYLLGTRYRWQAYDTDASGQVGGDKLTWMNTRRLKVPRLRPNDKDLTDFYKSGGNLRGLFQTEIDTIEE